jgi:succinyl-CoA synthetase beta subunit
VDLYEYMGKDLFRARGIPVPRGFVATSAEAAAEAARRLGSGCVVKVQVQVGGRGKGGGVVVCDTPERAGEEASRLLGSPFKGLPVTSVLCEELLPIEEEYYASCLLDRSAGDYLVMMTAEGGMDIEQLVAERPEAIRRVHVDPLVGLRGYHVRELTACLPIEARDGAGKMVRGLFGLLRDVEATLVEINPLVRLTDGRVVALDSKVTVDDNSLWRHEDLAALRDRFPIDPVEKRAKDAGLQYVKLDGTVGIIGNGAGLVMSTLDVVAQAGAHAANFLDIGGGASADTMSTSLEVILSDPSVKTVLVNIFGGITRCDVVAEGVLEALGRINAEVPIVVRLDGTNAEDGRRILHAANHPRIVAADTMLDAARRAAELSGTGS